MHRLGLVYKTTMREFDVLTQRSKTYPPSKFKHCVKHAGVSQSVFARVLNVTTNDVSQLEWEQSDRRGLHSNYYGGSGQKIWTA